MVNSENAWTIFLQAPLFMGPPRQEYWSGFPSPPLGDLPNPGTEPASLMFHALAGRLFATEPPGKPAEQPANKSMLSPELTDSQAAK